LNELDLSYISIKYEIAIKVIDIFKEFPMAYDDYSKEAAQRVQNKISAPKNLSEQYKLEWARSVLSGEMEKAHYYWERHKELALAGYKGGAFTRDLNQLRRRTRNATPAEALSVQDRAVKDLKNSGITENSLGIGELAPDFTLPTVWDTEVSLYRTLQESPVVLSFYRGAWCPFCTLELEALEENADGIREAGGALYNISPQSTARSLTMAEKLNLKIPLLVDKGNGVARKYGIVYKMPGSLVNLFKGAGLDLELYNDDSAFELPLPATFVIDKQKRIRMAFKEADHSRRLDPELIVAFLEELRGGT
jgi:peroxiredoxin